MMQCRITNACGDEVNPIYIYIGILSVAAELVDAAKYGNYELLVKILDHEESNVDVDDVNQVMSMSMS